MNARRKRNRNGKKKAPRGQAPPKEPQRAQEEGPPATSQQEKTPSLSRNWSEGPAFAVSVIAVAVIVVEALANVYQYRAMQETLRETQAATKASREMALIERMTLQEEYLPKIVATGIAAEMTDAHVTATVRFKNIGRAVVTNATIVGAVDVFEGGFDTSKTRRDGSHGMPKFVPIGPGEEADITVDSRRRFRVIPAEDFTAATRWQDVEYSKRKTLFVFGYIHPEHEFEIKLKARTMHIWFCYEYYVWQNGTGDWGPCWGTNNRVEWDRNTIEEMMDPDDKRLTVPETPDRDLMAPFHMPTRDEYGPPRLPTPAPSPSP